jgi:hypothetical protein
MVATHPLMSSSPLHRAAQYVRQRSPRDATQSEIKGKLVLRRGLSEIYYFFLEIFAKQNDVDLIIDRRIGERRHMPREVPKDQRRSDRRKGPAMTPVAREDFIVVRQEQSRMDPSSD